MKFWTQIWFLMVFVMLGFMGCMVVSFFSGLLIANGRDVLGFHLIQWSQNLLMMMAAPILWYRFVCLKKQLPEQGKWKASLQEAGLATFAWKPFLLAGVFMLVSLPLFDYLEVSCNRLPWPEPIYNYIMEGFRVNQHAISILLQTTGVAGFLELFLLMCLSTAIGEELMFRGALLSCFRRNTQLSQHAIAWIIGLIFAFIHFEPAGFLVRTVLGALLVYLVWWTGSLWPSVLVHCINNLVALVTYKVTPPEELMQLNTVYTFNVVVVMCSALLSGYILYVLWQNRVQK